MNVSSNFTNSEEEEVIADLRRELETATLKHLALITSRHGHSVIEEEYEELKKEIFIDGPAENVRKEALHTAAMCLRLILDLKLKKGDLTSILLIHR